MQHQNSSPMAQLVFGIAGGSGSGKTTVARAVAAHFGDTMVQVIEQDSYYRDHGDLPIEQRRSINYDHPNAFDEDLFVQHLTMLKNGEPVDMPIYDYNDHCRAPEARRLKPSPVLIVEGLLVLAMARVRPLLDIKIYVDTAPDLRLIRRLRRDTRERGRSAEAIISQYQATVRPMHMAFVDPSKRHADIIFPEGSNDGALDVLNATIAQHVARSNLSAPSPSAL